MRLLYASVARPASREANAVQINKMCSAFQRVGHDVLLTAVGRPFASRPAYEVRLLPWTLRRLKMRLMQAYIRRLASQWAAEIVFTRSPLLAEAALRIGSTAVLELHCLPEPRSETAKCLERIMHFPGLRRIVTISTRLAEDFTFDYGPPHRGCDMIVAHDGANAGPRPGPAPETCSRVRVGYFGHLYPGKGMEMIAKLAALLPDLDFQIYGGTDADIKRWRESTVGCANLHLYGYIAHEEVGRMMANCHILIAPYSATVSHTGGGDIGRWLSPLKLFEYMAAERPIVTTNLATLCEVVSDGETALLCPPDDTAAFKMALIRLASDPSLREQLGSAGRELLEAKYTWDQRAKRVLDGLRPTTGEG